jgi:hypothetical protein
MGGRGLWWLVVAPVGHIEGTALPDAAEIEASIFNQHSRLAF